ncbi:MAG: twin-arginine translocase TatA/TatE family subunit [Chloroflexi bacterium]|nr:twin-arginine translocase TatA/TatE family subunit [Chloroflexota bacterium]
MPFRFGPMELIIILVIVLVIFGAGKLSHVGSALGKGIREFRKGASGEEEESKKAAPSPNGATPKSKA